MCHMSHVTCHMSHVTCHMSHVICHMSHVTCHMSHVTCHVLHVTPEWDCMVGCRLLPESWSCLLSSLDQLWCGLLEKCGCSGASGASFPSIFYLTWQLWPQNAPLTASRSDKWLHRSDQWQSFLAQLPHIWHPDKFLNNLEPLQIIWRCFI